MKPMISNWCRASIAVAAMVWALSAVASAADLTQPAAKLAREIVGITGPATASIGYRNSSSLSPTDADIVKQALERNLRAGGVRLSAENGTANIQLTFSENSKGYLWVAEVRQGSDSRVAMVEVERAVAAPSAITSMMLRKSLLWSQHDRILDVALVPAGNEPLMLVLDESAVTVFKKTASGWQAQQSMGIVHEGPWPRDLRGRLELASDHLFDAYLPGMVCSSGRSGQLTMSCRGGDDPWPVSPGQFAFFSPARNFFTGAMSPGLGKQGVMPAFLSAAPIAHTTYTLWAFVRTDGSISAFDGTNNTPIRGVNWGAVAGVHTGCGTGTQLLATGAADETMPDSVRTFELADRSPVEAAMPVDFAGPITALWTTSGGASAIAVMRNLQMDRYDAFELTIACGQ